MQKKFIGKNNWSFIFVAIVATFFLHCDSARIVDENVEILNSAWAIEDKKSFSFDISKLDTLYDVSVNLRHTSKYAYRNIYLFVEMTSPSEKYFVDTVEIMLSDPKGKWTGKGIGNIWQNQVKLLEGVKMLETGTYNVSVTQGMRHDTLFEITDVGIRVEKSHE